MLEIKQIELKVSKTDLFCGNFWAGTGQITMISGPVGSGKTTFLRSIYLQKLNITMNGKKVVNHEQWFRQAAYVSQDVHLYDDFTFQELVQCFQFNDQVNFEDIGIIYVPDKKVSLCSEGEKQRICLLIGLWKKPALLILDEPTSFLDRKNQDRIMTLIRDYTIKNQCITLLSSHHTYDQGYADCLYEIKHQNLILKQGNILTIPLEMEKRFFDLSMLVRWLKKKVMRPMTMILSVLLLGTILFTSITAKQLENTRKTWMNASERYYLSYAYSQGSLPLYYYHEVIEINGEHIPVGIMNYYSDMNMFGQKEQTSDDIIVTDALKRKLNCDEITISGKTYEITNVMKEEVNKAIRETRYMFFIPDHLYTMSDQSETLYYVLTYHNEEELKNLAEMVNSMADFINGNQPLQDYTDLQNQLKSYRLMLRMIPLTLGIITVLIRIIMERKNHEKISLLSYNGYSKSESFKLHLQLKLLPLFLSVIVMAMPFFNREIPLYAGITVLIYFIMELKISFSY